MTRTFEAEQHEAEAALLGGLRSHHEALKAWLEHASSHWGYEDPVYRYYHQSFKVYALQQQTEEIVRLLASLAPGRTLNQQLMIMCA